MRILLLCCVFLVPICSLCLGLASAQCRGDQRALLLQLKNSLKVKVNGSKKLGRWNQSSDCCSWDGVNCTGGLVTGLNLSGESISGGLEDSGLFSLQNLRSLDLSFNNLSNSSIPGKIGNLTNLINLNLSNSGFGGQIPVAVSKLIDLVTLDLSVLPFWQVSSPKLLNPNLRTLIHTLSKLEELYLDGINISSSRSEWCQVLSSSVPNLRVLSLTNCYLSGPIDQSLEKLKALSVIRLDNNNLSSPVPRFLSNFSNLKSLSLVSCGLNGIVPREIFQVSTLEVIDITNNPQLQGSLPEFLENNSLRRLVLRLTNFSGSLPSSFGNLGNLSFLDLSTCQFNGTLAHSMVQLSRLVYVDLSFNKFRGPIPSFKMSKNLTQVVLSHNNFSGTTPSDNWEGLDKLVFVDLRNNLLSGRIPSSLFALPSLELLQLSNNRFDGQLPDIQNASSSILETLDLSSNKLQGPLPKFIFSLQSLTILSLSSNNLSGTLQLDHIRGLQNLTYLDLSNNNLSVIEGKDGWSSIKLRTLKLSSCNLRKFPNLKNQSNVVTLDLSNNQMDGVIPNWVWELGKGTLFHLNLSCNNLVSFQEPYSPHSFLNVLDLHSNNIIGSIPALPPSASYIDLSSNNFTSSIPTNIGNNLSQAIFFSLSNNSVTGNLPESICSTSCIQVLDLSSNKLSGTIPPCVPAMSQDLAVLNLQRNSFTGAIPDLFPKSCRLETLDLNQNSIQGKIPESLANCTKLEVLNLGNNELQDGFPCMLKNISALRVLVLRSNKFQGNISCSNNNGTWNNLQILDISFNNFSGVIPGKCISTYAAMHEDDPVSEINHIQFKIMQFSSVYYQDSVTITTKGLELEFVKILTLFTAIDLSNNSFIGEIPEEIGLLKALYVLNLSQNALTGPIPQSIGNLSQLESLDLSHNKLNGSIPESLAGLNFLSFLNLSYNRLVGRIPTGSQFQTFSNDSFSGNEALCGFPLSEQCNDIKTESPNAEHSFPSDIEVDWDSIYSGIGFGVGAGAIVALLTLWRDGKYWLEDKVDMFLLRILPMMGYSYKPRDEWDEEEDDLCLDEEEEQEGTELEDIQSQGLFCVFCSKLDFTMKRVIHDIRCTCLSSPDISSSSRYFSSSSSLR